MGAKPKGQHLDRPLADAIEALAAGWTRAEAEIEPFMSPPQLRLLKVLEAAEPMSVGTAADRMGSLPSSVTRLCNRLEAGGLVHRSTGPDDRREVLVALTADGRQFLERLAARRAAHVNAVIARMTPSALKALRDGLTAYEKAAARGQDGVDPLPTPLRLLKP